MLEYRRKVNRVLADLELTHVQFSVLASAYYLKHRGGAPSQVELSEHTGMDVMMTSQVLRSLERDRLVKRMVDKKDGRVKRVMTTPKGEEKSIAAVTLVEHLNEQLFGPIEDGEKFKEALLMIADRDTEGRRVSSPERSQPSRTEVENR